MPLDPFRNLILTPDLLRLVGDIDEFKGAWRALGSLAPDRLATLRQIATVESVGASTRIEGAKLTDREVDLLLSNLDLGSFKSRDEQEVAGYNVGPFFPFISATRREPSRSIADLDR